MKTGDSYIRKFVISKEKATEVLKAMGYREMPNGSFTKEIDKLKRFHAYIWPEYTELHIDKTINSRHNVIRGERKLTDECKKIRTKKKELFPSPSKAIRKRMTKVAPNVRELQRQASLLNANHKIHWTKRIMNYLECRQLNGPLYKFLQHVLNLL